MNLKEYLKEYEKDRAKFLTRPGITEELVRLKILRNKLEENTKSQSRLLTECLKSKLAYTERVNSYIDFRQRFVELLIILP